MTVRHKRNRVTNPSPSSVPADDMLPNPIESAVDSAEQATATRLIPATDWPDYHPWPPLGGLRHLIFHAESNGFHEVVKRSGRRVLIDERAFFQWLDEQNR